MGSHRISAGLALTLVGAVSSCANVIGLRDYGVAGRDGAVGDGTAGTDGSGGRGGSSGTGGAANGGDVAMNGGVSGGGGSPGSAGSPASSGSPGASGSIGLAGAAGSAGYPDVPPPCESRCDDNNACTVDDCSTGVCTHKAAPLGTACGVGQSCDAQSLCVRCRDTSAGTARDVGCTDAAPVCIGTGLAATCGGCTLPADCNDGNDCTSEACTQGKCVITPVVAGQACAGGLCNGTLGSEKCVACLDSVAGVGQDVGCTSAKPSCDPAGTATCYACVQNSDCATDNVNCTVETCVNHLCTHVATDSRCTPSGNVCVPNRCNASLDCRTVDISVARPLVSASVSLGNGSFEAPGPDESAAGWIENSTQFLIIYNCSGAGCSGSTGTVLPAVMNGNFVAWLGTEPSSELHHLLHLPPGTTKLQIAMDTNFQTESVAATNHDVLEVRLLDDSQIPIGAVIASASNATAQTGTANAWTRDGINKTIDVSAQADKDVFISLRATSDAALNTDFFVDNVRVTATVCAP